MGTLIVCNHFDDQRVYDSRRINFCHLHRNKGKCLQLRRGANEILSEQRQVAKCLIAAG